MAAREYEEVRIKELTEKVVSLNNEIQILEKERYQLCDKNRYRRATDDLHALYECFLESGFDEYMAQSMVMEIYKSTLTGGK